VKSIEKMETVDFLIFQIAQMHTRLADPLRVYSYHKQLFQSSFRCSAMMKIFVLIPLFVVIVSNCLLLLEAFMNVFQQAQGQQTSIRSILDQINQFVDGISTSTIFSLRDNVQGNIFDTAASNLANALRSFNRAANKVGFSKLESERGDLRDCLAVITSTAWSSIKFLHEGASVQLYDNSQNTETRSESDLAVHVTLLKEAINSKSDLKCLKAIGISENSLSSKYNNYITSLRNCFNAVSMELNNELIKSLNPNVTASTNSFNSMASTLQIAASRDQLVDFVSKNTSNVKDQIHSSCPSR